MAGNRTIITLPEEDKRWLQSYSRAHDISLAEAVRQGVQKLRISEQQELYRCLVDSTKGIWKKDNGLEYQENIRSEWHSS
jgi:hypothetical protein